MNGVPFIRQQDQVRGAGRKRIKPILEWGFRYLRGCVLDSAVKRGRCVRAVNAALCADESGEWRTVSQSQQRKLSGQGGGTRAVSKQRKWGNQNLKSNKRSSTKRVKMATRFYNMKVIGGFRRKFGGVMETESRLVGTAASER